MIEHKAVHLVPEWGSRLAALASPLQAAALLLVLIQFRRRGMAEGVRYAGAAVLASLVTAKVLSPQYLVWLFPFIVVLGGWTGSRARWLFLFVCLTTALIYPGTGLRPAPGPSGHGHFSAEPPEHPPDGAAGPAPVRPRCGSLRSRTHPRRRGYPYNH